MTEHVRVGACLLPPCDVVTRYAYDRAGNRIAHTDANQHTHTWQYDAAGRMVSATDALNVTTSSQYDAAGRMTAITDPRGASASQTLQYTDLDQLTTRQIASMGMITQQYNARGQRTALGDATGSTTFQYDAMGRITQVSAPQTGTVGYGYDARGLCSSLTYPDGTQIQYAYGQDGRLETVQQGSTTLASYQYDGNGRLDRITHANGVVTSYGYDSVDRLTDMESMLGTQVLRAAHSTLDREGQRTQVVETLPSLPQRSISYAYDGLQRLVSASENPGTTQTYAYDLAGNRTGVWVTGTRSGVSGLGLGVLAQRSAPSRNAPDTLCPRPHLSGVAFLVMSRFYRPHPQPLSCEERGAQPILMRQTMRDVPDLRPLSVSERGVGGEVKKRIPTSFVKKLHLRADPTPSTGTLVAQIQSSTTTWYTHDLAAPLSQILRNGTNRYVYGTPAAHTTGLGIGVWGLGTV